MLRLRDLLLIILLLIFVFFLFVAIRVTGLDLLVAAENASTVLLILLDHVLFLPLCILVLLVIHGCLLEAGLFLLLL